MKQKPVIKASLTFFVNTLSDVNDKRLQLNRSKGLAKYLTESRNNLRGFAVWDTTLGVMSFSLYILRFSSNLALLVYFLNQRNEKNHDKEMRELYLKLINDSLWCVVNMTQFFLLSFKKSTSAGLHGLQLETIIQFMCLIILLIRFQQDKEEYETKYGIANWIEKKRLRIEWENKKITYLHTLIKSVLIATVYGLYSFSFAGMPFSLVLSVIVLVSALYKLLIDINNDQHLIQQLQYQNTNRQQIIKTKQAMIKARLQNLNQIILTNVFFPIGFYLLLTTPLPLALLGCMSMLLVHFLVKNLIENNYFYKSTKSKQHSLDAAIA